MKAVEDVSSSFRPFPLLSQSWVGGGGREGRGQNWRRALKKSPAKKFASLSWREKGVEVGRSEMKWLAIVLVATIRR